MKSLLRKSIENDVIWSWITILLVRPYERVLAARRSALERKLASKIGLKPKVLAGPFIGLKYPNSGSIGSAFFPKLIGTYESELFDVLNNIIRVPFCQIIIIGCAEGYYAVGFARIFPKAKVVAFDISSQARSACQQMADTNKTENVTIREECTRKELLELKVTDDTLILSDCEGYEKYLFDNEVAVYLRAAHLVIELHDYTDRTLTGRMVDTFSRTHRVALIDSVLDSEKLINYKSSIVSESDPIERSIAFAEHRCEKMQWLVAQPKEHNKFV